VEPARDLALLVMESVVSFPLAVAPDPVKIAPTSKVQAPSMLELVLLRFVLAITTFVS